MKTFACAFATLFLTVIPPNCFAQSAFERLHESVRSRSYVNTFVRASEFRDARENDETYSSYGDNDNDSDPVPYPDVPAGDGGEPKVDPNPDVGSGGSSGSTGSETGEAKDVVSGKTRGKSYPSAGGGPIIFSEGGGGSTHFPTGGHPM